MRPKTLLLILSVFLIGSILIRPVQGKEYPTKPIQILCAYTAGGSVDMMVRLVAEIAPKYLGQSIVVINKPGGAGSVAAAEVISSEPDGYKLFCHTSIFFATTVKTQKIPFDPNDLIPIANMMEYKNGIFVKGDSPWQTFGDLLDYAKKNSGKLRWAHTGRGTSIYLNTLLIFRKAGVETIDIPYQGVAEMLPALLGGHIDAVVGPYAAYSQHVKAGNVKGLIFFNDRRYSNPSNVPCAVELGFPEAAKLRTIIGFYAHKNVSEDIRETLYNVFKKTSDDPEFKKGLEKLDEELTFGGPEFMKKIIKENEEVGVPILKELGLLYKK